MIEKTKSIFTPPKFEDEGATLAASILYGLMAMVVGVTLFLTFPLAFILPEGNLSVAVQGLTAILICALIFYMIRKGAVRWASVVFLSLFFFVIVGAVLSDGGILSSSFMNFMILVFASGLLLGARAGFIINPSCYLGKKIDKSP
jgi:hypothetical protein